jgi:hypothetical protein
MYRPPNYSVWKHTRATSRNKNSASPFRETEKGSSLQLYTSSSEPFVYFTVCSLRHIQSWTNIKRCLWRIFTVINEYLMHVRNTDKATIHFEQKLDRARKPEITLCSTYNLRPNLLLICLSVDYFVSISLSRLHRVHWDTNRYSNKEFWEEPIACFPRIQHASHSKRRVQQEFLYY